MQTSEFQKPQLIRIVYMLLFSLIGRFVAIIVFFAAIFQFIYSFFLEKPNQEVLKFTDALSIYAKDIIAYVAMNSESKPWPIGTWPKTV